MKIVQEKEKVGEILSVDQGCQEATNSVLMCTFYLPPVLNVSARVMAANWRRMRLEAELLPGISPTPGLWGLSKQPRIQIFAAGNCPPNSGHLEKISKEVVLRVNPVCTVSGRLALFFAISAFLIIFYILFIW